MSEVLGGTFIVSCVIICNMRVESNFNSNQNQQRTSISLSLSLCPFQAKAGLTRLWPLALVRWLTIRTVRNEKRRRCLEAECCQHVGLMGINLQTFFDKRSLINVYLA